MFYEINSHKSFKEYFYMIIVSTDGSWYITHIFP
jgi:hypothetical protein